VKETRVTRGEKGNNQSIRLRLSLLPVSSFKISSSRSNKVDYPFGLRRIEAERFAQFLRGVVCRHVLI
jgi:hypothetical protein